MIDTKPTAKEELLESEEAKNKRVESSATRSKAKQKKSSLKVSFGQKKPVKKTDKKQPEQSRLNFEKTEGVELEKDRKKAANTQENKTDTKRAESSRINFGNRADKKQKTAKGVSLGKLEKKQPEPSRLNLEQKQEQDNEGVQAKTPKKKKKGGGLLITSKIRPKAKPKPKPKNNEGEITATPESGADVVDGKNRSIGEKEPKPPPLASKRSPDKRLKITSRKVAKKSKKPPLATNDDRVGQQTSKAKQEKVKAKVPPLATKSDMVGQSTSTAKKEKAKTKVPPLVTRSSSTKEPASTAEKDIKKTKAPPLVTKSSSTKEQSATAAKDIKKTKLPPLSTNDGPITKPTALDKKDTPQAISPPLAKEAETTQQQPGGKEGAGEQKPASDSAVLGKIPLKKMAVPAEQGQGDKSKPVVEKTAQQKPKDDDKANKAEGEKAKEPITPILDEPESLLSLLEPDPEEVTKLKQGPKQDRFLSQSVVLEESGLATLVRSSILLVAVLISLFLVWASFTRIDEMASTTGQVIPNSPVQVIQHLEGGIIEEIFVSEGQIIQKDGKLARLSPKSAEADLNQMRARLASLMAQKIRIVAMLDEKNADFSVIPKEYDVIVQGQKKLLSAQRNAYSSQLDVFNTRIDRAKASMENLLAQQEALQLQIGFSKQEMEVKKLGYQKGLMSRLMVIAAKRDKIRVESELVRVIGSTVGARKDLHEAFNELDGFLDKNKEENLRELGVITAELSQVREGMARLDDRVKRLTINSPVWGIVKDLKLSTVGGVVGPGSVLTEIIPLDATRRVETMINTKDIGHVKVGQGVTVKISTFDFARYGGIDGILESISATTFEDPTGGEPFYKGIVRLQKSHIGNNESANQILPGMVVQADIHTGSKTLMEYLLKPIYASVNRAFQER
ncbi:MAG: HlyD family type I secretion periplasmic adaptor subunit [Magnetococcales bacterium]|nr:HlyD family type I secretion periplasmic adaptor subunit [Magnetococcales bacterium]